MAIESIARRLLDWIDLDDEEAAELLPETLAESLPDSERAGDTHPPTEGTTSPPARTVDAGDTASADESSAPTLEAESDEGSSRLRRFGPYLLGLGAALTAFVGVLGVVRVVKGWIEELRVGHTPMDAPDAASAPDDDRPAPTEPVDTDQPVPAADRSLARTDEADEGDALAALVGLGFHKLVDGVVSRPPAADEGTTIPVERVDD